MRTSDLKPPSQILRPFSMDSSDIVLLSDSIERCGLLTPVTVVGDTIVDGYRRWMIFRAKGWDEIPTHSVVGDPVQLRVIAQTRHAEFGRTEKRALIGDLLTRNRQLTANEIAHSLQWPPAEVESMAGVEYLIPAFQELYKSGRISLADVWQVSRCREIGQGTLLDEDSPEPLYERAMALHRENRCQRRRSMTMRPRGKSFDRLVRERDTPRDAGPELLRTHAKTPMDGWRACLEWVLSSGK